MQFQLRLPTSTITARPGRDALASTLAQLIVSGAAGSKADLARATGLSRTMIEPSVDRLLEMGVVRTIGKKGAGRRSRPGETLAIDPSLCLILVADCGFAHCTLAVFDVSQRLLASESLHLLISEEADERICRLAARLLAMVEELGLNALPRRMVFGSAGFVDRSGGRVIFPPHAASSSWDGYPLAERMSALIGGHVHLEHDVALRAIGEASVEPTARGSLAYVKVGSGIGLALVSASGSLEIGADGFAGQIAHVRVTDDPVQCSCGNTGCLGAVASMLAMAASLDINSAELGWSDALLGLIRAQDPRAVRAVKLSGEYIGQAIVDLINLVNPERVVLGGNLAGSSVHLLAAVRSVIYDRGLPVTTRSLTVSAPRLGAHSGIAGGLAVALAMELAPEAFRLRSTVGEEGVGRARLDRSAG